MFRFIHSSDLHLGKRFGNMPLELRGRLREARHAVIGRLASLAREHGAGVILLAGDTFDTETPTPDIRRQALAEMSHHAPLRWVLLPGNHDSLQATQLWNSLGGDKPENVVLVTEPSVVALAPGVALLPAPCTTRRPGRDLTEWMDGAATDEGAIRLGLAHAAILDFSEDSAASDVVPPDRTSRSGLDYLALGDWHGAMAVEALKQSGVLQAELQSARQRRDDAQVRRTEAATAIDKAMAEIQAAESEETQTRELLARLDAALKARQAFEELEALQDRLARAEVLRGAVEEGEAALALIAVPADMVEALEQTEIDIVRRRAAEEAGLPSLLMTYAEGASAPILMDGQSLPHAEERAIRDRARLEIPGIGTLTVRSNRPAEADGELQAAEQRRRDLLASIGVVSLGEARQRQSESREKSNALERQCLELRHLAPEGLPKLREEVARRAAVDPELLELKADPDEARQAHARADRRVATARNGAREVQPLYHHASDALTAAETAFATVERELARLEASLGPDAERAAREQALAAAHDERKALFESLEAHSTELRKAAPDLPAAEAALRRATSVEEAAKQEETRLQVLLADLNGQIRTRSEDAVEEAWQEAKDALEAATARVSAFETEVATFDRLNGALQSSRSAARDLYLQPVITQLRPLLGLLFDDISIAFDEKTLLPQTIRRNGQDEEIDRLSGGMREQLSVLTRLAFARLLAQDRRPAPVILDDALVYSDDDRIERMFDALHRQSRDQQIIVFSCRQRAFAKLGGNVLHMTPWQPALP